MFPASLRTSFLLLALVGTVDANAASGDPEAARFQRVVVAVLECRADPTINQTVGKALRAAMYGDTQQRPAHLSGWRFERSGDEDDPVTIIDMPIALTAQGVTTRRMFVDAIGFSIPIDGAQQARIVAEYSLRLRSSTLREPYRVWSRDVEAAGSAPATAVVVRSDGDGYRLGCAPSGWQLGEAASAGHQNVADADDLAAAAECRATPEARERVEAFWDLVLDAGQDTWPAQVQHLASRDSDELYVATLFDPIRVHGVSTRTVALGMGLIAAAIDPDATAEAVRGAAMTAADQSGAGVWEKQLSVSESRGNRASRSLVVLQRDGEDTLVGCMHGRQVKVDR